MEYTFEDWLNGKFKTDDLFRLTAQYFFNQDRGTDYYCIPPDEIKKIRDAQKEAFFKAVEINTQVKIKLTRDKVVEGKLKNPKNWLRLEIEKIEKFLSEYPELEQLYELNSTEHGNIRPNEITRINGMYERFMSNPEYYGSIGFSVKRGDKYVPLRLTDVYVNKEYLDELNKLNIELDNDKPFYSEMKKESIRYYNENREHLQQKYKQSANKISIDVLDHLKVKFQKLPSYPSTSTIRKDWLKLTS